MIRSSFFLVDISKGLGVQRQRNEGWVWLDSGLEEGFYCSSAVSQLLAFD